MKSFVYSANSARILFGEGRLSALPDEVQRLGARRVMVLTTPQQRSAGAHLLASLEQPGSCLFDSAVMHTPTDVTARALDVLREQACDGLVAFGGGSTIGLAKALSLRTGLPQIAIPTTYAGSEVTPILGETTGGVKTIQRTAKVLPAVVIYDVNQTLSLPVGMSASSGLNAVAHAAEALYSRDANPIITMMAEEGIAALVRSLPLIMQRPSDLDARTDAQYGAWLCGTCLGAVEMSLHHKLCHVLGGAFDLPHAETHAIVLPYALAYVAPSAPDAMARLGRALGSTEPAWVFLHRLLRELDIPTALGAIGMPESGIDEVVDRVLRSPCWSPRPIERTPLRLLLGRAFSGAEPAFG